MKGIYLACYRAYHPDYNIDYQDILGNRDISGDMLDIDLTNYDFVIATPPCNYYSRANYRRDSSLYALQTKHLLPCILIKLCSLNIPFIVENVRNKKMFKKFGLYDLPCFVYEFGRHTYWSNVLLDFSSLDKQLPIVDIVDGKKKYMSSQNLPRSERQGTQEVHDVVELFLRFL